MPFIDTLPQGRLPENDVAGMRDFLATMFIPDVHESFYIQVYVAVGCIIFMSALIVAILTRRIVNRSAWIVQSYHTPQGVYWIPNAVTSREFACVTGRNEHDTESSVLTLPSRIACSLCPSSYVSVLAKPG